MATLGSKRLSRSKLIPRGTPDGRSHVPGVPDELAIEIDKDGSPVSTRPSDWFVCFVPGLQKQWWHRFTDPRHKHVFALKMVSDDHWVLFEPWWTRIMVTALTMDEALKFLRWGAVGSILKVEERIPGDGSQTRGWANCAVLISLMLGRSYWTWTPHGLYKRLSVEQGVEPVDLTDFLEKTLISLTQNIAKEGLGDVTALTAQSPEEAFNQIGLRISKILFAPKSLTLYRLAVSEAPRFPTAAEAFFTHGPHQVVDSLKMLIEHFCDAGQLRDCDPERTSRAFLAMLRGNLYLEIVLGCEAKVSDRDLELRTQAVVDLFLRGIGDCL